MKQVGSASQNSSDLMIRILVLMVVIIGVMNNVDVVESSIRIINSHADRNKSSSNNNTKPIVIWHGMGDSCCFPFSMGRIETLIRAQFNSSNIPYIHSIRIGNNEEEDVENSYLMNANKQVQMVCDMLKKDPNLKDGFNAIGFSQGSQFLRAFVQRCNLPKVNNLISIGGQHQGVYGLPKCIGVNHTLCEYVRELLDIGVYWGWIQDYLVQAEYWHDPFNEQEYIDKCIFLPDINNYGRIKNETYKINLKSLNKFVMVKFLQDSFVQPIESEQFEFYQPGQDKMVLPLRESPLYQQDWLGLQEMDKSGKLVFLETNGDHLQFTDQWFVENIIPYLK